MSELQGTSEEQLWSRLTDVTGHDKVEILFELAQRAFSRCAFQRSCTILKQVVSEARELGDNRMQAEALFAQGSAEFNLHEPARAADSYERATDAYLQAGAVQQAASSLLSAAEGYEDMGRWDKFLEVAQHSHELALSVPDELVAGEALYAQARALHRLRRPVDALKTCEAAHASLVNAGRPHRVAQVDDLWVRLLLSLCSAKPALRVAKDALVLAQVAHLDVPTARLRLGEVRHRLGQHKKALKQAQRAQDGFRAAGDHSGVASCEWLFAKAHADSDDTASALSSFARATVLLEACGRANDALQCQADHALVLHRIGKYRKAARINTRLVEQFRTSDATCGRARHCVVNLFENLHAQGKYADIEQRADDFMSLWPQGTTAEHPSYRVFLALWAYALFRVGQEGYASALAAHVLNHSSEWPTDAAAACCLEVRGMVRRDTDRQGALGDLTGAIRAYLISGQPDRARWIAQSMPEVAVGVQEVAA